MNEIYNASSVKDLTSIATGEQSKVTQGILDIADSINGKDTELIENITSYIHSLKATKTKDPDFTRTAEQIIQSGEQRGCHEAGLVFVTLLRAKGKEATYIQALLKKDLIAFRPKHLNNVRGHVFIRLKKENEDVIIDSTTGEITKDIPDKYIIGGEGLDSWDIGLKEGLDNYLKLFTKIKNEKYPT